MSQGLVLGPFSLLIYILSLSDPIQSHGYKHYPYGDNSLFSPDLQTSISFWKLKDLSKLISNTLFSLSTWMSNGHLKYKMPKKHRHL